jgi:predicted hotdog family 3-hydroxylacyl-ACP dehydratase
MNESNHFPVPTAELHEYLPHRDPMIWVDQVLDCGRDEQGIFGTCRVQVHAGSNFRSANGEVRPSSVVEWIAQGYGFMKACHRRGEGHGVKGFGRAFLAGISECEVDLSRLGSETSVRVSVREVRDMHPAYIVEGSVTSEDGTKSFGRARITVFGGELPITQH